MKLHVSGWKRSVIPRMLINLKFDNCDESTDYPYHGVNKEVVYDYGRMSAISGIPPFINFKFRIAIGKQTMGGNYQANIFISKDEVISMFVDMFGDKKLDEVLGDISEWKLKNKS